MLVPLGESLCILYIMGVSYLLVPVSIPFKGLS